MDMEQRKVNWANRIFVICKGHLNIAEQRLIVSICQDAFNDGYEAGYNQGREAGNDEQRWRDHDMGR